MDERETSNLQPWRIWKSTGRQASGSWNYLTIIQGSTLFRGGEDRWTNASSGGDYFGFPLQSGTWIKFSRSIQPQTNSLYENRQRLHAKRQRYLQLKNKLSSQFPFPSQIMFDGWKSGIRTEKLGCWDKKKSIICPVFIFLFLVNIRQTVGWKLHLKKESSQ